MDTGSIDSQYWKEYKKYLKSTKHIERCGNCIYNYNGWCKSHRSCTMNIKHSCTDYKAKESKNS